MHINNHEKAAQWLAFASQQEGFKSSICSLGVNGCLSLWTGVLKKINICDWLTALKPLVFAACVDITTVADLRFYTSARFAVITLIEGLRQELRTENTHTPVTVRL